MTKEQKYLIDNGYDDLIIKGKGNKDPKTFIYVSDVLALFSKAEKAEHNSVYTKCKQCLGKGYWLGYGRVKEYCDKCNGKGHFV